MNAETTEFLVELGTEELPPKSLKGLSQAFTDEIRNGLEKAQLGFVSIESFASPRRLAVLVTGLNTCQPDQHIERKGPALQAAFDKAGQATKAALGFARSCGVDVDALETLESEKGGWLVYREQKTGALTETLLPEIVKNATERLPIPRRMTWGAHKNAFVRPVHWLVMLLGKKIVECEILGKQAGNVTFGHRFMKPEAIEITTASQYSMLLHEQGRVVASYQERKSQVKSLVMEKIEDGGGIGQINEALLEEVTALVEWPVALLGRFDEQFLTVPQEALISAMVEHQKYFPVIDQNDRLLPYFVTVANIESKAPERVVEGNERVIRPRLQDADFFFRTDKQQTLESFNERLKNVVFQQQLGTVYEKAQRISLLASHIAAELGGDEEAAMRAGLLCKADLATDMVGEFPDLQGAMGGHYARAQGEPEEIAQAITEQYKPRFQNDTVPCSITSAAVAIADKLDTLVGIFGIGRAPTGEKDPFALRRAALGILKIVIENDYRVDLKALADFAITLLGERISHPGTLEDVLQFMRGRYRSWYQDQGVQTDIILSVLSVDPTAPADFDRRIKAVCAFVKLDEASALAAANKRVGNILAKADRQTLSDRPDKNLFEKPEEHALAEKLAETQATIESLEDDTVYQDTLATLAKLRGPIDDFFDAVMVNVDDEAIRNNRLTLLSHLQNQFMQVADISKLPH